ncbi:MAG: hypothetical protein AAGJ85_09890 [Pseudomonadota bacterium]
MITPLLIGLVLTIGLIWVSRSITLDRDPAAYATTMIAIALFYVVFAIEHGDRLTLIINVVLALVFIVGALVGYVKSVRLIAFLLIGHGLFDATYHFAFHDHSPAPHWWAPFCFGVDFVLGFYLLWLEKTKPLKR